MDKFYSHIGNDKEPIMQIDKMENGKLKQIVVVEKEGVLIKSILKEV